MDRWACVNLRAFPLQLLLVEHPEWRTPPQAGRDGPADGQESQPDGLAAQVAQPTAPVVLPTCPVAVVSHDTPQGLVLYTDKAARRKGVVPGMRYITALGLVPELRAGVVSERKVREGIREIARRLQAFSPEIEPSRELPGIFWLNASGLHMLYSSATAWCREILDDFRRQGFLASVSVGYTRFGTLATGALRREITIFRTPEEERAAALDVPIASLGLPPNVAETFGLLKVLTIGDFLALPAEGVRKRFGEDIYSLHVEASGAAWRPLSAHRDKAVFRSTVHFDAPESDSMRLVIRMARMIHPLLRDLEKRGDLVRAVRWTFSFEKAEEESYIVRPAEPTCHQRQLLDLIKLQMESIVLPGGVMGIDMVVLNAPARFGQDTLFETKPARDLSAANRALARLRALFGPEAVVHAELHDAHLPEATFRWEPLRAMQSPRPRAPEHSSLVRRLYTKPEPLSPLQRQRLQPVAGPHMISGGWWMREVSREYHFARDRDMRLLWVYYDHRRKRWFVQGEVE